MTTEDALFAHLGAIEALLEKILARLPEPHEHEFGYAGSDSWNCWCGKPPPPRCGFPIGPWVNSQRPACQQFKDHEGECG